MPVLNITKNINAEHAKEQRKCHRKAEHSIAPGELHLAVYEGSVRKNYCHKCCQELLEKAASHIADVQQQLRTSLPTN